MSIRMILWTALALPIVLSGSAEAQGRSSGLPPQAAPPAQAQFDGELEVLIEDHPGSSRTIHFLNTQRGRFKLDLLAGALELRSGSRVRVNGRAKDDSTIEADSPADVETLAAALPNTLGEQRVAVFLVNFQDNPSMPYTPTTAYTTTFQTVGAYFNENSYGRTWLTGTVFGWYTLPMSSATCDTNQIAALAEQAATAAGYNISSYTRRIYAFPQIGACSWWGLGSVGGNPSRAWVNGSYALKVVGHELGHNFGDYHSRSLPCTSGNCSAVEYGDDADIMGNPTSGHLNAFQKERLGWLNSGTSPPIASVTASGDYWIGPYAVSNGSTPNALKVVKSINGSGQRTWYYLEARTQIGFDNGVAPGVIVHTGSESSGNSSFEIDLDPVGSGFDSRLDVGQVFTDSAAALTFTVLSADASGALVRVGSADAPCVAHTPSLSVTPAGDLLAQAGTPVTLSVHVTNNDDTGCGASTFDMHAPAPSGWTAVFSPSTITVSPGSSVTASLTVTPSTAASGSTSLQIGAYRDAGDDVSTTKRFVIVEGLQVAVSTGISRSFHVLSAAVSVGGAPASGASVTFVVTDPDGATRVMSATAGSDGVASVNFKTRRKDPSGVYTIVATASLDNLSGWGSAQLLIESGR